MNPKQKREALPRDKVALIHLAKSQLQLSEADYRGILQQEGGVTSSTLLNEEGFHQVMAAFERLGFESTAKRERRMEEQRRGTHATYQQRKKIQALWDGWKGKKDASGLNRWLSSHFHVDNLRFVSREMAPKVIGALANFSKS